MPCTRVLLTVFESTVSSNGREDVDNFTRELLGMDKKREENSSIVRTNIKEAECLTN